MLGISGLPLRLLLAGGAAVAVLGLAGGAVLKIKHDEAVKWRARVVAAQKQAAINDVQTQAVDRYHEQTIVIRERADRAVQSVQQAPGAATAVDPDRRAIVCASLERVRQQPVCTAPDGSPDPSSAVQGANVAPQNPG